MNELHLFAGAGGGILGGMLLRHTCVCAVEIEPSARAMLLQRQRDGVFHKFPIWDDVTTFDGKPWRGIVDIVCGGFPCQDISTAGKGAGIHGERSGLWKDMARIISQVMPRYVFVENSSMLTVRGLGAVLRDLAELGFDAIWGVLGPEHFYGQHQRKRIWILAYPSEDRLQKQSQDRYSLEKLDAISNALASTGAKTELLNGLVWPCDPTLWRVVDGMADWSHRVRAIGNGQVPAVAALAWGILFNGKDG